MSDEQRRTDDEQAEDWPPPTIEGEWIPLPGLDDVPERPAERGRPSWTA